MNIYKLRESSEKIETSIILLDNPGKIVTWNQSATISAMLINNETIAPIPHEILEFYIHLNESWVLLSTGSANESGIAEFAFFVNMENGDYQYKISYPGSSNYLPAEEQSYFTVTRDPLPEYKISNVKVTDAHIKFDCTFTSSIPWPYSGGLTYIYIYISIYADQGKFRYKFEKNLNWQDYSSYSRTVSVSYLKARDVPGYDKGELVHVGEILDMDYTDVEILLYVEQEWYKWTIDWIKVGESNNGEILHYTLIDDDPNPPAGSISYDTSITLQYPSNYNIHFTYSDKSGWTGYLQYKFSNETYESPTYGPYLVGSTSSKYTKTFTYGIPQSIWSLYPGTTIEYNAEVIDHDLDGGRANDQSGIISGWIAAGKIFADIGANVDKINSYVYMKTADVWNWQLMTISPDYNDPLFRDLYVNDENHIYLTIANPTNEAIIVISAVLRFSCT